MKEVDTKKLVLGCLVIMILMILYTKIDTGQIKLGPQAAKMETQTEAVPVSRPLLLTDRTELYDRSNSSEEDTDTSNSADSGTNETSENREEEEILGPAEPMDVDAARKEPYGLVVELDYVSVNRISLHGSFGYMVFSLENSKSEAEGLRSTLERAVTFEELGGINMGGAAYTDILAGEGLAMIVPGIHNKEIARRKRFLYIEETNEITGGIIAPEWMMEKVSNQDYSDAVEAAEQKDALKLALGTSEYQTCKLLYGPVVIPEFNSNTYGFLSADGDNLENLWYGLWNADMNTIVNVPLFQNHSS